jgi:hypothetical protein
MKLYLGCYYHGCPKCNRPDSIGPNGKTARENYQATMDRLNSLEPYCGMLNYFWECEIDKQIKSDPEMKKFFQTLQVRGRLDPRDAYFGGRTGNTYYYM